MNDGSAELRAAAPHQIKINQIHSYVSYNFMGDDGDDDDCSNKLNWFAYGTRIKKCLLAFINLKRYWKVPAMMMKS